FNESNKSLNVLNMIDQIRDGSIDKDDLHDMFASLGWALSNVYLYEYLEAMMNEAPGPVNFTMFLTVFGEKLNGTNPEDVICNAFACFDEEGTGKSICLTGFSRKAFLKEHVTGLRDPCRLCRGCTDGKSPPFPPTLPPVKAFFATPKRPDPAPPCMARSSNYYSH
uniref:EF-hand domain-containing protein n=1 Tax=Oryzias latipes TaxID=8090 RepID=A0A3P9IU05_ORYLA